MKKSEKDLFVKALEDKVSKLYQVIKELAPCQECRGCGKQVWKFTLSERKKPCEVCKGTGMSRSAREKLKEIR